MLLLLARDSHWSTNINALQVAEKAVSGKVEALLGVFVLEGESRSGSFLVAVVRRNWTLVLYLEHLRCLLLRNDFGTTPDAVEEIRRLHTHSENILHGLLSCVGRWHDMGFQLQGARSYFLFRKFGLFRGISFCSFRFFLEQSYCVTNGVANFLVGEDIIEFVPSLGFAVQLGEANTGGSNFLEDIVDHSDFLWAGRCLSVVFEVGTNYSSEVSVAVVVGKDVSTSAENIGGAWCEVDRKHQEGRHLVLL